MPTTVGALTAACGPNAHGGSGLATDKGAEAGHILAFGGNRTSGPIEVTPALLAQPGSWWKGDFESETFIASGVRYTHYSHDYANDRITDPSGINPELTKQAHTSGNLNVAVPVTFPANLSGTQHASAENLAPSMGATNPTAVALCEGGHGLTEVDAVPTLQSQGGGKPGQGYHAVRLGMQVRRLTPRECERLQGFPDDYTAIPWRKKPASECPDGPRYKALGNSWAVPCVRWIGQRINNQLLTAANDNQPAAPAAIAS